MDAAAPPSILNGEEKSRELDQASRDWKDRCKDLRDQYPPGVHSESEWASVASVASAPPGCWLLALLLLLLLGRKLRRWKKRRGDLRLPNVASVLAAPPGAAAELRTDLWLLLLTLDDGDGVADALQWPWHN